MPRTRRALGIAAVLALAAGCGATDVDRTQLEVQVKRSVEQKVGDSVGVLSVSCPDRLKATTGAQTHCTITTTKGKHVDALVTVTGTDDNRLQFDLKLAQNPAS